MAGSSCHNCGAQYQQIKTTCPNCGAMIEVPPPAPPASVDTQSTAHTMGRAMSIANNRSNLLFGGIALAVVLALLFIGIISKALLGSQAPTSSKTATTPHTESAIKPEAIAPVAFSGDVSLSATTVGGGIPMVVGDTNLPDGTLFLVSLSNKATGYEAATRVAVRGGRFSSTPFTYAGHALKDGDYTATITMVPPDNQPANVRSAIGQNGEKLAWSLVTSTSGQGKSVAYRFSAQVRGTPEQIAERHGDWQYREYNDDLTGKPYRVATLTSTNSFEFGFPYAGPQHAELMLRNDPKTGRDAILMIERGQILCHSFADCSIEIVMDGKSPRRVQGNEPADHSTTAVFLPQPKRLMDEIAKAQQLRIRFNVFQEGVVTAVFNVEGFDLKQMAL